MMIYYTFIPFASFESIFFILGFYCVAHAIKICRIVVGISINALDSNFIYFSVLFITSYNSLVTEGDVDL